MAEHHIRLPLTEDTIEKLRVGDSVLLSGSLYTARDAAHRRMVEALWDEVSTFVDEEAQCCPFFTFEQVEQAEGVLLRVSGKAIKS